MRSKQVSAAPESKDVSLTDLWLVIRKRRVLLAVMAVGVGLLAAGRGFLHGKWYTAAGEVRIQPGSGSEFKQAGTLLLGATGSLDVTVESDIRILESRKLLTSVAEKLDLQDNPVFMNGGGAFSLKPAFLGSKAAAPVHRSSGRSCAARCGGGESARASDRGSGSAHADDYDLVHQPVSASSPPKS